MKIDKISFLLILVRDSRLQEAERNVRRTIDICIDANGLVMAIASSLVYVTFGTHPTDQGDDREATMGRNSRQALQRLRAEIGADVKLVSFTREAGYGTYGDPNQMMVYGAIVPAFGKYLGALAEAQFGEIIELDG